ncbi:DUF5694 domain-containing protein [Luteimonas sp. M1R5S18]|uniref:DUF5694 domain-containing protein n=1 Tax=Luteimonas rhizosphaericola TaxID=3042024 RepID=A0ABT6JJI5_9GAMM|nr:DUF5694 domain-containing protein [Luteimonas rhizosphaericola]MDH5830839.1 DUF5694 domain-containing protein [Luteimonas rhizosphaericola]
MRFLPLPRLLAAGLAATLLLAGPVAAADARPIRILLLGTFHMHNPGQDAVNIDSDDVLAPRRQAELEALADALLAFAPTKVAVEARTGGTDLVWPEPLDPDALRTDRNEIVQVAQRLAMKAGIKRLHAVDVTGEFDLDPLRAVTAARGAREMRETMAEGAEVGRQMGERLTTLSIPGYLDWLNSDAMIEANHRMYRRWLRVSGDGQYPGAKLVTDWYARNMQICARILQVAQPGDNIVVLYGVGHVYWLRECMTGLDDVEVVHPSRYLQAADRARGAG